MTCSLKIQLELQGWCDGLEYWSRAGDLPHKDLAIAVWSSTH